MYKNTGKFLKILVCILGSVFMLSGCNNPSCGSGYNYCPNPAGLGGICCSESQYCASTGGRNPGPACYPKPLLGEPVENALNTPSSAGFPEEEIKKP